MEKVATPEGFYLAYLEAHQHSKILDAALEVDAVQVNEIMRKGLENHIGVCTGEEKEFFEFFGGEKAATSLEDAILGVHSRLGDLVARDFVGKLSMDDAAALIRILRATPHIEMILGGCFDGIAVRENDIIRHWCNTHAESRNEFLKMIGRG